MLNGIVMQHMICSRRSKSKFSKWESENEIDKYLGVEKRESEDAESVKSAKQREHTYSVDKNLWELRTRWSIFDFSPDYRTRLPRVATRRAR